MKDPSTQNTFEVLNIPEKQVFTVLEEGEVPQTQIQTSEEVRDPAEPNLSTLVEGHSPTYAEMAKKKKLVDKSGSSKEDPLERSSKKGRKSYKTVREKEAERLKMLGS